MYVLYALEKGKWTEFARFADTKDYETQMRNAIALQKTAGKTEEKKKAACVLESFVLGNYRYGKEYGKLVMRALRHFDEVGLSNDVQEKLEELLDEGYGGFALLKDGVDVATCTDGTFSLQI